MTDSNKTPPVLSPQQIVRARYKQQMMPPRTWKQQQARQEQIEAVNRSRQVTARQAYTAAAAKASSSVSQTSSPTSSASQGSPVLRDLHSFSKAAEQPSEPLHVSRRSSSTSSMASNNSSEIHRPPPIRRSSSSSSVSRAAVLAAQNSVSRSPHSNSASSRLSSVASSRRGSTATIEETISSPSKLHLGSPSSTNNSPSAEPKPLRPTQLRPLQTGTLPTSGLPSKGVLSHGLPKHAPLKLQSPRTVPQRTQKAVDASKAAAVPTSHVNPADAAAFASVRKQIPVEPRAPLSSKFASSLTQALKRKQDLRLTLAEELALEAITDSSSSRNMTTAAGRRSQDSVRSVGSTLSTQSGLSMASQKHQSYVISPDSFLELKSQQQKQQQQQNERRIRTAEENKANALRAAIAAGSRVETDMASIHIQVNEAVQTALKRQNRKLAMQKYSPAASWSSTRMFRPQLRKLQTSDSLKGSELLTPIDIPLAPNLPNASRSHISGPQSAGIMTEIPRSAPTNSSQAMLASSAPSLIPQSAGPRSFTSRLFDAWTSKSNSEVSLVDSELSSSPGSQGLPEKWICEPPPKVNMTTLPTKQTTKPAGKFLSTLRTHPRATKPSRNHEIVVRDPLPSQTVPWPNSQAGYSSSVRRSSMEMRSGFDFRNSSPQQSVEPQPQPQLQPLQQRMPKTLREYGSPRFNQDKPWKGHREATELSVRERKRYESLWAANKDVHLPYMCVPVKYQKAWIEALTKVLPELFSQKSGTPLSSTTLPSSTSSSSPKEKSAELSANPRNQLRVQNTSPSLSSLSIKSTSSSVEKHDSGSEVEVDSVCTDSDGDAESDSDNFDMLKEVAKWRNDVHGYVVARLWRRSCLAEETLAQVWDLVDSNKDGTLDRSAFVVGMWLCDQCLYGRKLPSKVPSEVWQSVGSLNLKVRFKQKRSKIGYVRGLPNMVGNAVGFTMHGGRQIVKKTVQNATK